MSDSRISTKVGLFVLIGLTLLGFLILNFSKGLSLIHPTYSVKLLTRDVGGIKRQAQVLLGGLRVGSVGDIYLAPDGKRIVLRLDIDKRYPLRQDAKFSIDQSGFLGDQHVSISPQGANAPLLSNGAEVECEEPFNLQLAAKEANELISTVKQTVTKLDDVVSRVSRVVLNDASLTNVSQTLSNLKVFSEETVLVANQVQGLLRTNAPLVSASLQNVRTFTEQINQSAQKVDATIADNRGELTRTIQTLKSSAETFDELLKGLRIGNGMAGSLLQDTNLQSSFRNTLLHLDILSSNLSRFGILHKPRPVKTNTAAEAPSGKGGYLLRQ